MPDDFEERRRSPRVVPAARHEMMLGRRSKVKVVDISANGVLLASEEPLSVGTRGRLQVLLGPETFEGHLEVRRIQTVPGQGWLVGAQVSPAQPRHAVVLEQFLRRAGN